MIGIRMLGRGDHWASITLSAKQPGRWQLTWHDGDGPIGDTLRDTIGEVIVEALRDGYRYDRAIGPLAEMGAVLVQLEQAKLDLARIARIAWTVP